MRNDDAINIMNGSNLTHKRGFYYIKKMSESANLTYYQKSWDVILNRAIDYYENDKERLREQARYKYRNLSEEEKNKKREYGKNRYLSMPEEKKQRLKEYQKKLSRGRKVSI